MIGFIQYVKVVDPGNTLPQPEIELLATDLFQFTQTGSRSMSPLTVKFQGSPVPSYQPSYVNSELFGAPIKTGGGGWIYIDAPGNELSFTGSSTTLTSFTLGVYYYMGSAGSVTWSIITQHNLATGDYWTAYGRITVHVPDTVNIQLSHMTSSAAVVNGPTVPSIKTGWVHWTFAYEQSTTIISI